MSVNNFVSIAADYLYVGMELTDDVFAANGTTILITKGGVLDEPKLTRLRKFLKSGSNVVVSLGAYKDMMTNKESFDPLSPEMLEQSTGYSILAGGVKGFMSTTKLVEDVSPEMANSIVDEMAFKINTIDLASLLQCINVPRPVEEQLERHITNVGLLNGMLGKWYGLPDTDIDELVMAGIVHDVGKTKIPSEILDAPRKLTAEEFEVIKMHPVYSEELLSRHEIFTQRVIDAAKCHHEKVDGSGYPLGLTGDKIPVFAKITAITDIYDAMVSKRCYKGDNNPLTILAQFNEGGFIGLDEELTGLFVGKMATEFVGKKVLMNDQTIATITMVPPFDVGFPIVEQDGVIKQTDEEWNFLYVIPDNDEDNISNII